MPYFRTPDGCSLYYETIGFELTRPAVVFLNGTLQTTLYWKRIAASLKPHLRSLLYDARGQGESELGRLPLSLDLHLTDLLALIQHFKPGPVSLVGSSHGALLAYALARQKPQTVDRLVLCSVGVRETMRTRLIVRSWLTIIQTAGLEALVNAAMPIVFGERYLTQNARKIDRIAATIMRRNRQPSLRAHLAAMADYPTLRAMLGPLGKPLLMMCGSDDPLVNVRGTMEAAQISGGRYLVVPDAGHSIPVEAPQLFLDTITRFLTDRWTDMPEAL